MGYGPSQSKGALSWEIATMAERDPDIVYSGSAVASKLVNFVFMLRRTPTEHEAQERRRCDRILCVARLLSA